jgi:thymidylate synthase
MINPENLYEPTKYKVILGEGRCSGFCTVWNEAEKAIHACPDLLKKSAIIGTLYSRQGVNIIIRNLALNPQIQHIYLWTNGTLSCSPFGVSGKEVLLNLFKNGIADDGIIKGTDFKIEKEIDINIVRKIIENVKVEEMPEDDLNLISSKIENTDKTPYMDPVSFPPSVPEVIDIFPSEKVGFLVRGKTVIEAWTKVVDKIMRYGVVKGTQYGNKQKGIMGITWVIENEDVDNLNIETDWPESLKKIVGLNLESINHYKNVFLSADTPAGVTYTYGNRLMKHPGKNGLTDQIEEIILKEFKDSIDTRRAVMTTIVPEIDKNSKEPPCITQIQVFNNEGKLYMFVTIRANDIFTAGIPNAFGLRFLHKHIANKLNLPMGPTQITSQIAYVAELQWDDAKKLVSCAIWDREPNKNFDPSQNADPRGLFVISNKDNKISAYFKTPTGDDLLEIKGETAKDVMLKIGQLELSNTPSHLLDIGAELQKAEIALKLGIPYIQDKPLPLQVDLNKDLEQNNVCIDC